MIAPSAASELHVEIQLDFVHSLIVPMPRLPEVLDLLMECMYKPNGYGEERTYKKVSDRARLPTIVLVSPAQLSDADDGPTKENRNEST